MIRVDDQCRVKLTRWQHRIVRRSLDDLNIVQSFFAEMFLELHKFDVTDILRVHLAG